MLTKIEPMTVSLLRRYQMLSLTVLVIAFGFGVWLTLQPADPDAVVIGILLLLVCPYFNGLSVAWADVTEVQDWERSIALLSAGETIEVDVRNTDGDRQAVLDRIAAFTRAAGTAPPVTEHEPYKPSGGPY